MYETQVMVLKMGNIPERDAILGLRGTKAMTVGCPILRKQEDVTTWSSLVRVVLNWFKPYISEIIDTIGFTKFNNEYTSILRQKLQQTDIKLNSNCPIGIFKTNEIGQYINSSVYLNNKNHSLEIYNNGTDSYSVCAVYTGEIVFVVSTLIDIIGQYKFADKQSDDVYKTFSILLYYANRSNVLFEEKDNAMSDDTHRIISINDLTLDLISLATYTSNLKNMILDMTNKYDLNIANDLISDIFSNGALGIVKD